MTQPKITMYTRPDCSDVTRAQAALRQRGLQWDEIDIERDPGALRQVKEWTGGSAPTPTLLIGDTVLVEPAAAEIDAALAQEAR